MTLIRWTLTIGLVCGCGLAGTGNAATNDRALKLLQLQTLNRLASESAPTKKNASGDNSARQDRGANRPGVQSQPDNRGVPGNVPTRRP
ncbi:hypothetical protein [Paraburkholderia fynbosensis]|uniref:Lipoprotein n=1 Tax=Paraburkholderia fynbosensis TaxID=1200993 RepID=A0A6J5GYN4_9BURK|nr:hypothetical protein [Paraburkholderia fynbosensis]CAB3809409.1 hypothetical protein LMG27177_06798 [Paraburkholderia fynbosensis]